MSKFRFRSYLDDGLFVVLIMAAALAAASLQATALWGAYSSKPGAMARAQTVPASAVEATATSAPAGYANFIGATVAGAER